MSREHDWKTPRQVPADMVWRLALAHVAAGEKDIETALVKAALTLGRIAGLPDLTGKVMGTDGMLNVVCFTTDGLVTMEGDWEVQSTLEKSGPKK